jgi:hypothetical protein
MKTYFLFLEKISAKKMRPKLSHENPRQFSHRECGHCCAIHEKNVSETFSKKVFNYRVRKSSKSDLYNESLLQAFAPHYI